MNYRVTVSLRSTCPSSGVTIIRCEKVIVYKPLPFQCRSPIRGNPKCLEHGTEGPVALDEKCSSDRDDLPPRPSHCKPGGFCVGTWTNAGDNPELNDVLDFAKIEAKNSLLGNYGVIG